MKRILTVLLILCMASGCACEHQPDATGAASPDFLETAAGYLKDGEYGKAIESYSALIREEPANAICYLGRAEAYARSGDLQSAEADYRSVIELDNTIADAYVGLAEVYVQQDDYESATATVIEGIAVFTGMSGEGITEGIQKLKDELGRISEKGSVVPDEAESPESGKTEPEEGGGLILSDFSYAYQDGAAGNQVNAAGMMRMSFNVAGPSDCTQVRIGSFGEEIPDPAGEAEYMVSLWKEKPGGAPENPRTVPFTEETAFPVHEEDFGKMMTVLLIGLDANMDSVGYTTVRVTVSR